MAWPAALSAPNVPAGQFAHAAAPAEVCAKAALEVPSVQGVPAQLVWPAVAVKVPGPHGRHTAAAELFWPAGP